MDHARRIIVIGSGLSGLAAARALSQKGFDVIVLEARDRIGGRCHTKDRIDLGAHWIHGTEGNPITVLARECSINTLFVGGDSSYSGGWNHLAVFGPDGRAFSAEEKQRSIRLIDEIREDLDALRRERIAAKLPDISIQEALSIIYARRQILPADARLIDWHVMLFSRDDCAAGEHALSMHWWDDGYEVYGYGDSVFLNGYSEIVQCLAADQKILLEHEVREINHSDSGVEVVTQRATFTADGVIVTLPLGVLKAGSVKFNPPLPERKMQAIERLGFGNLTKVIARYETPFWPQQQYVFGYSCGDVRKNPTTLINMWKTHKIPALVLLIGGEPGREIERQPLPAVADWAKRILRDVFGPAVPPPLEILRSEWSLDPFARGAYSYLAVGSTPDDIDALAEPVGGCVFFAGEATYRNHWAAAHGAYASGLREAARISGDASLLPGRTSTENRRWREMMLRASRFFAELSTAVPQAEVDARLEVLRASDVFSVVPPNELRVLATMFENASYQPGETICKAGDAAHCAFLIAGGTVQVRLPNGRFVATMTRGNVAGEYGMFGGGARTATLVAQNEASVLTLDYQRFQRFLLACPESSVALLRLTVQRLVENQK